MKIVPLQLKIESVYGKLHELRNNITSLFTESNDKELFRKCREIWNKIIELIGINKAPNFVKSNFRDDEVIMVNVHKNTSFVEGNYRGKLIIVLHSVIDNYPKTLIQAKTHKCPH